ncbi:MAG: glycosyltransferase [Bacteroidetes bacterium]|nr:glycosyltransferase [Bacteroidota bacterium]
MMAIRTSFLSLCILRIVNRQIIYISYDGMTDPLGQSQVIPYLIGLSSSGFKITLLSCEKKDRYALQGQSISNLLRAHNIQWEFIFFTSSPPILAKYYDLFLLKRKAIQLQRVKNFSLVHCRSYVSAAVGLFLKKKFGLKFLFDIRGFWVDERVDGGLWNMNNPIYKFAYKKYKIKEANYIASSDTIVSLTENGKKEIQKWGCYSNTPIDVIPCCADYDLFSILTHDENELQKIRLGFSKDAFVLSYLGSIGTWYMLDEMLDFFILLKEVNENAKFLFVSNGDENIIKDAANKKGILLEDLKIVNATRSEVPKFIQVSNLSLSFIKPAYSKKSSSPTKLGELLALGIPVICNTKIGDVEDIIKYTQGGLLIEDFSIIGYKNSIEELNSFLKNYSPVEVRERSKKYYDLKSGIEKYKEIYFRLLK